MEWIDATHQEKVMHILEWIDVPFWHDVTTTRKPIEANGDGTYTYLSIMDSRIPGAGYSRLLTC